MREAGHELLSRLGKKRLRPGGKRATEWLFSKVDWNKDLKVLEVACNKGTNLIELVKRYDISIIGLDKSTSALKLCQENIDSNNLNDKITILEGDATKLPFEDEQFDVVINEAMLTMLPKKDKEKALKEYYRVLKPNGILLTHDIVLTSEGLSYLLPLLGRVINVPATPLTLKQWQTLYSNAGFKKFEYISDEMTLLSKKGLEYDEGIEGMKQILENAEKDKNKEQFFEMMNFFEKNKDKLYFIACANRK